MKRIHIATILIPAFLLLATACSRDAVPGGVAEGTPIAGFFLLNEGDIGQDNSSLDYYDYTAGIYYKSIHQKLFSSEDENLGEGGNDLQCYGSRLYVVLSGLGRVMVIDLVARQFIGQIQIPNCRYIVFQDGYAYVSSYAASTYNGDDYTRGYVAKIDLESLRIVATCEVGYQPEEMVITNGKLYVANSGIYQMPDYEHTVSVIDLASFEEIMKIDVAPNLHRMELDAYGKIWVSSRGDYYDIQPVVFVIDTQTDYVVQDFNLLPCSDITLCGDSLYVLNNSWNAFTQKNTVSFAIVDVSTRQIVSRQLIKDGTDDFYIQNPHGIAVNPQTHEFCIADAGSGDAPGNLYYYSAEGRLKWRNKAGRIPSRIAFTTIHPI